MVNKVAAGALRPTPNLPSTAYESVDRMHLWRFPAET